MPDYSQLIPAHWYTAAHLPRLGIHGNIRYVLTHNGSMTALLSQHFQATIAVHVIAKTCRLAQPGEARLLSVSKRTAVFVREVILIAHNTPCLWGRTILPLGSRDRLLQAVMQLDDTPLASILFRFPNMQRDFYFGKTRHAIARCTVNRPHGYTPMLMYETFLYT